MKIVLFDQYTNKKDIYSRNGLYILDNIVTACTIKENLAGDEFSLSLTVSIQKQVKEEVYNNIIEGAILRVKDEKGFEIFRITSVTKSMRYIDVVAQQITITDTITSWLEDVRPELQNGQGALNWIKANAIDLNPDINLYSNIDKVSTAYYMNKNVHQALMEADNDFLERWGGEIRRRGFDIMIDKKRGIVSPFEIRSCKNLTGFEMSSNVNELVTVIYPQGYDGITAPPVYSPLVNNYARKHFKEIKWEDVKLMTDNDKEGFPNLDMAIEELTKRAEREFKVNKIDEIKVLYKVDFVSLAKSLEYEKYKVVEQIDIGDIITVIEDTYNLNIQVKVIEREYDVLREKRISTVLSNSPESIRRNSINAEIKRRLTGRRATLSNFVNDVMEGGLPNSYVTCKKNEIIVTDALGGEYKKNDLKVTRRGLTHKDYDTGEEQTIVDIEGNINIKNIKGISKNGVTLTDRNSKLNINLAGQEGQIYRIQNYVTLEDKGDKKDIIHNEQNYYPIFGFEDYVLYKSPTIVTTGQNKIIKVFLDESFKRVVDTNWYSVNIHKVSWGDFTILQRTADYFILEAQNLDFYFFYDIIGLRVK